MRENSETKTNEAIGTVASKEDFPLRNLGVLGVSAVSFFTATFGRQGVWVFLSSQRVLLKDYEPHHEQRTPGNGHGP